MHSLIPMDPPRKSGNHQGWAWWRLVHWGEWSSTPPTSVCPQTATTCLPACLPPDSQSVQGGAMPARFLLLFSLSVPWQRRMGTNRELVASACHGLDSLPSALPVPMRMESGDGSHTPADWGGCLKSGPQTMPRHIDAQEELSWNRKPSCHPSWSGVSTGQLGWVE